MIYCVLFSFCFPLFGVTLPIFESISKSRQTDAGGEYRDKVPTPLEYTRPCLLAHHLFFLDGNYGVEDIREQSTRSY